MVATTEALVTMADGTADAEYVITAGARRATSEARLLGGALSEVAPFDVELNGTITALGLDRGRYRAGEAVTVTAAIRNDGRAGLEGTALAYAGAAVRVRTGVAVTPAVSLADAFTFILPGDVAPGLRPLSLAWQLSCGGDPIAFRTAAVPVAPAAPAITTPFDGALVSTSTPAVEGSGVAGASVTVTVTVSGAPDQVLGPYPVAGDGTWGFAVPSALAEGPHAATATQAVDGVASDPSLGITFVVDTIPPGVPTILSPWSGSFSRVAALGVSGTAVAEAAAVRLFVDGAGESGTVAVVDGDFAGTVTLGDGVHQLSARARDSAGNFSADSALVQVTVDTVRPEPPAVTTPGANDAFSGQVHVAGTAEQEPTVVEVTIEELVTHSTTTAIATRGGAGFTAPFDLLDGAYRVTAIARDAALNESDPTIVEFSVDTVAPGAPTFLSPAPGEVLNGLVASAFVQVVGTTEAGATVTVEIDGLGTTAVADGSGGWTARFAGLAQGEHLVFAKAKDAAANESAQSNVSFVLDTVAPDLQVTAPATTVLGAAQVPGGVLFVGGTAELDGLGAATVDATFASSTHRVVAAGGTWGTTFDLVALGLDPLGFEGALEVQAVDLAGNGAGTTTLLLTIDQAQPTGVAGFVTPPSPTNLTDVPFRGSVPADAVAVAVFDAGVLVTTVPVTGGGSFSFTVPAAEGDRTYTVHAVDAAGNLSDPVAASVTVDLTAPGEAALDPVTTPTSSSIVTFTGTLPADLDVVAVVLFDGASAVTTVAAAPGASFEIPLTLAAGFHAVTAQAMDLAGNLGTASALVAVAVDLTRPGKTDLNPVTTPTSSSIVTFTGTLPADSDVVAIVLFDGTNAVATRAAAPGASFSIPLTLAAAPHEITARALDLAGNLGTISDAVLVDVNRSAPAVTALTGPAALTNAATLGFSVMVTGAPVSVSLLDASGLVTTVPVSGNGTYAFSIPAPADGSYTYRANAGDLAGNTGPDFGAVTVQVDRSAPVVTALTGPAALTNAATLGFSVTVTGAPVSVSLFDASGLVTTVPVSGNGTYAFSIPAPADGSYTYRANAADLAGNTGPDFGAVTVQVDRSAAGDRSDARRPGLAHARSRARLHRDAPG